MLFSATQTRKLEDLARVSLKKEPMYVGVDDQKDMATVEGLEQVIYSWDFPTILKSGLGAGDKNISILHLSCRTSDLQFSLVLQTHVLVL